MQQESDQKHNEFKYDFDVNKDSKKKCLSKLQEAIDYLKWLNEPAKIMLQHDSYEAIFYINKVISYKSDLIDFSLFSQLNCQNLFGDLLLYLYETNSTYDFRKHKIAVNEPNRKCDQNERYISIFFYLLDIISIVMCESDQFRPKFQSSNGLKSLINFIRDREFVKRNLKTTIVGFFSNKFNIVDFIVSNINLSTKKCSDNKAWLELDAIDALLEIAKIKSSCIDLAYSSIINICNDKQLNELNQVVNDFIIKDLVEKLKTMSNDFRSNQFNRKSLIVDDDLDDKNEIEIHFVVQNDMNSLTAPITTPSWFVFDGLTKLALNLDCAYRIYFENGIKETSKSILLKANQHEKILVLKMLSQLTFNEKVAIDLARDVDFIANKLKLIVKQCELVTKENVVIKHYCELLLLNLDKSENEKKLDESLIIDNQIYLSCSKQNKEISMKLKDMFETERFKIVSSSLNKYSSLSQMIDNIKSSSFVILVIDESYRSSLTCQIESSYSSFFEKRIIPVVLKDDFDIVDEKFGWIGEITKSLNKIYFKKSQENCQELFDKIKSEIDSSKYTQKQIVLLQIPNNSNEPDIFDIEKLEIMSYDELIEWLKSKQELDHKIIDSFIKLKCDGKILKQLLDMKKSTPEFFEQSFTNNNDLDKKSISELFSELDHLFYEKKS